MFSSSFLVLCLIFESLSRFEFIFVYGVRACSNVTGLHGTVQLSQPLAEEIVFSPLYIFAFLDKD